MSDVIKLQELQEKPRMAEISFADAPQLSSYLYLEFFDDLEQIRSRAPGMASIPVYKTMVATDGAIANAIHFRKSLVTAAERRVEPSQDSDKGTEAAELCIQALQYIDDFHNALYNMLDAIPFLFTHHEILWELVNDPNFGRIWVPRKLIYRAQELFSYENGVWLAETKNGKQPLPEWKFVTYIHNPGPDRPTGFSVLEPLKLIWLAKRYNIRFWSEFNERFAGPTLLAFLDTVSWNKSDYRKKVLDALIAFRSGTVGLFPEGTEIKPLEVQRNTSINSYESFIQFCDTYITQTILGTSLATREAEFGTRAQAQVHQEMTFRMIASDAKRLSGVIRDQLLLPIIRFNRPELPVPRFVIDIKQPENLDALASVVKQLVDAGLEISQAEIRERFGFRQPEGDEPILQGQPPGIAP